MKILFAEDDEHLGENTLELLTLEHFCVDWAKDGAETLQFFKDNALCTYDVVLLDWMMPFLSGLEVCKILREKEHFEGGIIFTTAKGEEEDCIKALNLGADDYVVKPYRIKELVARINAVNRRKSKPFIDKIYQKKSITLNQTLCEVAIENKPILKLRRKEFDLFALLFTNINTTLPRETILEKVWEHNLETNPETLDSHIYSLRKKIKEAELPVHIELIKGIGYEMKDEINDQQNQTSP